MRMKLPAYGPNIGTYLDDISYAMLVAFILVLIFNLPSLLRKISLLAFVFAIQFLVFAEWWNFEFYRDYIRYASLGHTSDFQEILRGLEGFQNRQLAIWGSLVFLVTAIFLERKSNLLRSVRNVRFFVVILSLLFALIPTSLYTHFYKLSQIENWYRTTAIPLNYKNPVLQIFREKYIHGAQLANITPLHVEKVNQLYNKNKTSYPFYQHNAQGNELNLKNIIFIILESVRKYETMPQNDIDITPNFNQIASTNFTPNFYYANSNQTIKAEIALLCGIHDFLIGTSLSAANHQQVKANCLPQILKKHGYGSYWFHGAKADFFNRDQFLPKIGFDELHDRAVIMQKLDQQLTPYVFRHWGIEDPYTFEYAFDYLENVQTPFLAEILTVSNHHPFVDTQFNPGEDYFHPGLVKKEDDIYNRYLHMTSYTDKALGQFWQRFENSQLYDNTIVVVSGDHGIWLFDTDRNHDSSIEEAVKYESYLRLPLTIYFPGKSYSEVVDVELSQVDVPNIIATYMGLQLPTAFQSKLNKNDIDSIIGGRNTPEEFANPIFSSIGDNFYYRNSNTVCYPPSNAVKDCDDFMRRCIEDHNVLQTDKTCIQLDNDLLTTPQAEIKRMLNYDIQTPNIVVDYFRKSIYFGAMPENSILSSK